MTLVRDLIEKQRQRPARILVLGDAIEDLWHHGNLEPSQDGVQKFTLNHTVSTPGGAANASRQLTHWSCRCPLLSPLRKPYGGCDTTAWGQVDDSLAFSIGVNAMPRKHRYLVDNSIVFRCDEEREDYDLTEVEIEECRTLAALAIRSNSPDAVLICDYTKGFLSQNLIATVVRECKGKCPCVIDAKREVNFYRSSHDQEVIIKGNAVYFRDMVHQIAWYPGGTVFTNGPSSPFGFGQTSRNDRREVPCVNHVGAGDSFSAHLVLALAHGFSLSDGASIAHSAGRVFVQSPEGRPPWPHEVMKDHDPAEGKLLVTGDLQPIRRSLRGKKIVFTNGVYRLAHAGHVKTLQWARDQGDVLVVGVNDDESARRVRKDGQFIAPLSERLGLLSGLACVDWVIPFAEDDPVSVIKALQPDVLVKGEEYRGCALPGEILVGEVRLAPMIECAVRKLAKTV